MTGYARWNRGEGHLEALMDRGEINRIEDNIRREFEAELSTGSLVPDRVLQDMRRATQRMLESDIGRNMGLMPWRKIGWWRDPTDPTRVIMYY